MQALVLQVQMLLAALSAFLPLVPSESRGRIAEILDAAGRALSAGGALAAGAEGLAEKFAAIRAEVEAMAASGRAVSAAELDSAMARIHAASSAFRAALRTAEGAG